MLEFNDLNVYSIEKIILKIHRQRIYFNDQFIYF